VSRTDRSILRLAVPTLGALVAQPLFVLGDSAVVARLGPAPLAGLGIAATVVTTVTALCIFLAYGTTAAVARLVGAGRRRDALHQGIDGLWLGVGLGVVLAVVLAATAPWIVGVFDAAPDVDAAATTYLRISALGMPALLLTLAATGVLRGLQDVRTPLVVSVVAAAVNLGLNIWLVLVLELGIAGSAWGTVIVETLAALTYLAVIARGVRRESARLRPDTAGVRASARAAAPLVVRVAAIRLVTVVALAVAAGLGTEELAAYQLVFAVYGLVSLALDALAIAGQTLVGQGLGAGDRDDVRRIERRLLQWGWGSGVAAAAALAALTPFLVPVLTPDEPVQDVLLPALLALAVLLVPAGPAFTLDGVLLGAGDFRWLARQQVISTMIGVLALVAVGVLGGGLVALWAGALTVWMVARLVLLQRRASGTAWMVAGA
jgi:putative MATE family efflux protein